MLKVLVILSIAAVAFSQTCEKHNEKDINLPNLSSVSPRSETECCNICSSTGGCQAYSWNSYEGGTCWLKSGTGPLFDKEDCTAGILGEGNPGPGLVSYQEFSNAVTGNGYPAPSTVQYEVFVASAGPKGLITTKQEAAMALVHFLHESDGLRAKREYRCENDGCPSEYNTPGCDVPGQRYFGRGYIQLTWCYNYGPASTDLFGDGRLVTDPDMVAREETVAWDTAFWFWKVNVHYAPGVQDGRFGASTKAIDGVLECDGDQYQDTARHRYEMYKIIRRTFGLSGDGDERGCYN